MGSIPNLLRSTVRLQESGLLSGDRNENRKTGEFEFVPPLGPTSRCPRGRHAKYTTITERNTVGPETEEPASGD